MARQYAGCRILHQKFLSLEISANAFDGIFANASLFHVPSQELPRVFYDLYTTLRQAAFYFYPTLAVMTKAGQGKDTDITCNLMPARNSWKRQALK